MTTVLPPQTTEKPLQVSVGRREPDRFRTTPGRLRLLSLVSVGAIVVLLIVSAGALSSRRNAARSAGEESGVLLVQVQALYQALADADASASISLLRAGGASIQTYQHYVDDLDKAGRLLAGIADHSLSSRETRSAVGVIARELPRYSAQVESARVQTRLKHPIGAQQMRDASERMREKILPATEKLYTLAADELNSDYDRGTSASQLVWIVVIGLITLAVLAVAQLYAARHTNRILNVGLVIASLIVVVVLVWSLVRFTTEQDALVRAQRNGSDSVQLLSAARILGLKSQANANIALGERGTGDAYRAEFTRLMEALCGNEECKRGLLAEARDVAGRTGSAARVGAIQDHAAQFWSDARQVVALDDEGRYGEAVDLALSDQANAAKALDDAIVAENADARARFGDAAQDARSGFAVLAVAVILGLLLAAVLVLVGLQPRIAEYR